MSLHRRWCALLKSVLGHQDDSEIEEEYFLCPDEGWKSACTTAFLVSVCRDIESHPVTTSLVRRYINNHQRDKIESFVRGKMATWHTITVSELNLSMREMAHFPKIDEWLVVDQITFHFSEGSRDELCENET